jgi:hypothetical protein
MSEDLTCPDCKGDGRRLNPAIQVVDHGVTVQVRNPDRLPLLVRCPTCRGSGRRRP